MDHDTGTRASTMVPVHHGMCHGVRVRVPVRWQGVSERYRYHWYHGTRVSTGTVPRTMVPVPERVRDDTCVYQYQCLCEHHHGMDRVRDETTLCRYGTMVHKPVPLAPTSTRVRPGTVPWYQYQWYQPVYERLYTIMSPWHTMAWQQVSACAVTTAGCLLHAATVRTNHTRHPPQQHRHDAATLPMEHLLQPVALAHVCVCCYSSSSIGVVP